MATYLAAADGNFSAGSTWALVDSTSFLDSEANSTASTTAVKYSAAFTPGAITVDGCAIKLGSRVASPTGTITLQLFNSTGALTVATVTINASDIQSTVTRYGWVFFKFAAPVTLLAATAYEIGLFTSVAGTVTFFRNATANNWSRALRTTTTGTAPVAADVTIVCGERTAAGAITGRTVTYDVTATTIWGNIYNCDGGTMQIQTTASTNYNMYAAGNIETMGNSTWSFDLSGVPTSTFTMHLASAGLTIATGNYGHILTDPASYTMKGKAITNVKAFLAADVIVGATSITTNIATGWAVGDQLVIAGSTQNAGQYDARAITSISGTTIGVSALSAAHSGTAPNAVEIINITRSVLIQGDITNGGYVQTNGTKGFTFQYVQSQAMGYTSGYPFLIQNTGSAALTVQGCSWYSCIGAANTDIFYANSGTVSNLTFDSNNFGVNRCSSNIQPILQIPTTSGTMTVTNNTIIGAFTAGAGLQIGVCQGTFTGNTVSNTLGYGMLVSVGAGSGFTTGSNLVHSGNTTGIAFTNPLLAGSVPPPSAQTLTGFTSRRNLGAGFDFTGGLAGNYGGNAITFDSFTAIGNGNGGAVFQTQVAGPYVRIYSNVTFSNWVFAGDSSFGQGTGLLFAWGAVMGQGTNFTNCTFGVGTAHTVADVNLSNAGCDLQLIFNNCNLASTGKEVVNPGNLSPQGYLGHQKWKQTANSHRTYFPFGTITLDTTIFNLLTPSTRLTPSSAATKLPTELMQVPCDNGATFTYSAYIRRSVVGDGAAYNGTAPRLIMKADPNLGFAADVVLATSVASAGTWELLTGTITAPTDNGTPTIVVDCDGTAGWVNVDDTAAV
jgi:hypothetical protein